MGRGWAALARGGRARSVDQPCPSRRVSVRAAVCGDHTAGVRRGLQGRLRAGRETQAVSRRRALGTRRPRVHVGAQSREPQPPTAARWDLPAPAAHRLGRYRQTYRKRRAFAGARVLPGGAPEMPVCCVAHHMPCSGVQAKSGSKAAPEKPTEGGKVITFMCRN